MKHLSLLILSILFVSCSRNPLKPEPTMSGNWVWYAANTFPSPYPILPESASLSILSDDGVIHGGIGYSDSLVTVYIDGGRDFYPEASLQIHLTVAYKSSGGSMILHYVTPDSIVQTNLDPTSIGRFIFRRIR
jgi:hypothetical protein